MMHCVGLKREADGTERLFKEVTELGRVAGTDKLIGQPFGLFDSNSLLN